MLPGFSDAFGHRGGFLHSIFLQFGTSCRLVSVLQYNSVAYNSNIELGWLFTVSVIREKLNNSK